MRKHSVILGCVACVLLSQASVAMPLRFTFKFSKPETTYVVFRDDEETCLSKSTKSWWSGLGTYVSLQHSFEPGKFVQCMVENGYKPSADGEFTAKVSPEA